VKSPLPNLKIGLTLGDPSGIGPQIAARAVSALGGEFDFVIIGDRRVFDRVAESGLRKNLDFIDLNNVSRRGFKFGKVCADYGRASIEYLDKALELIKGKRIDCLVTAPISKEAVKLAGYNYSGHTEYFAQKCNTKDTVMMLLNNRLRCALVTRHIPLAAVSSRLTTAKICKTTEMAFDSLRRLFKIKNPRIVISALNPHASDNGLIGREEERIIQPAMIKLRRKIPSIQGPLPADTAVSKAIGGKFDCVVSLFHDQALIPLKISGADSGVNLTLGLEFIRTTPLHGVAFDIAAKRNPAADIRPMIEAIKLAAKCTRNQKRA